MKRKTRNLKKGEYKIIKYHGFQVSGYKFQEKIMENIKTELEKALEFLKQELSKLRIGRATPALVEDIKVNCYGTSMPLKQVATINAPESDLIVISPWDKGVIVAIEKAIETSSLGINPIVDGEIIRLKMPSLTEERRKEFTKLLHEKIEESRVAIRNIREKSREEIKGKLENREIDEDEKFEKFEEIDELVKKYNDKIEEVKESKEKELMTV